MGDQPYTDTELEAGARALDEYRHFIASDGYPAIRVGSHEAEAQVVLEAVLPEHAARIRQETAEEIEAYADRMADAGFVHVEAGARRSAEIAREHTTTEEDAGASR